MEDALILAWLIGIPLISLLSYLWGFRKRGPPKA